MQEHTHTVRIYEYSYADDSESPIENNFYNVGTTITQLDVSDPDKIEALLKP